MALRNDWSILGPRAPAGDDDLKGGAEGQAGNGSEDRAPEGESNHDEPEGGKIPPIFPVLSGITARGKLSARVA